LLCFYLALKPKQAQMQKAIQIIDSLLPLKAHLKALNFSELFVLCDENTKSAVYPSLKSVFEDEAWNVQLLTVAAGEQSKDWRVCLEIWGKMSGLNADRKALMLNVGGGMIADLGAFVASIYKRGISFVQLPTSLLGMTDAAIGGKCGIDFLNYKNQLGLFAEPKAIFIYPPFLESLPKVELKSGFAEVLKHALIADVAYWNKLKSIEADQWQSVAELIAQSVAIKSKVVESDPLEKGERKKLNFGHTVGHGIESYFLQKQKPVPHGFAIAAGMLIEAWLSIQHAKLSVQEFEEIAEVLQHFYPVLDFTTLDIDGILAFLKQDKKMEDGKSRFTLLTAIGKAKIDVDISENDVRSACLKYLSLYGET